jgi:growth hormone-inducible transmembrane protein
MASTLRRPFAVTAALKQAPLSFSTPLRSIHSLPPNAVFRTPVSSRIFAGSRNAFQRSFRRMYIQQTVKPTTSGGDLRQRLLYGAGIFGGTLVAINLVFNRETREDGGMPHYERSYLNDTFAHTGLGIGIIGVAATALHRSGWSVRLMSMNPWLVLGGGLVLSIGSMVACRATSPEK